MNTPSAKSVKVIAFGFFGIICFSFQTYAQEERFDLPNNFNLHIIENIQAEYAHPSWLKGDLIYANNSKKSYDSIRFNNVNNDIEIITNGRMLRLLPGLVVALILKEGNQFGHLYGVEKIDDSSKYLEVLSVGNQLLYSLVLAKDSNKIPIEEVKMDEIRFEKKEEPKISFTNTYYILNKNGLNKLKLSQKAILKITKYNKEKLALFIKNEHLSLHKRQDIAKLFDFINKQ